MYHLNTLKIFSPQYVDMFAVSVIPPFGLGGPWCILGIAYNFLGFTHCVA
jgi:hypothetical protein